MSVHAFVIACKKTNHSSGSSENYSIMLQEKLLLFLSVPSSWSGGYRVIREAGIGHGGGVIGAWTSTMLYLV